MFPSLPRTGEVVYNKSIGKNWFRLGLEITPPLGTIIPGQFVHLKLTSGVDPLLRRPFSIYNVFSAGGGSAFGGETHENEPSLIEVVYQVVGKGTFLMAGMKAGTRIDILGPLGNGFSINPLAKISILVAGGIGIAGLHLLLKYLIELGMDKDKYKIYNLVGGGSKEDLYLLDTFKRLSAETMVSTENGSKGVPGLVTDLLQKLLPSLINSNLTKNRHIQVYACGPQGMIKTVCRITEKYRVPCQVSLEQWLGCGLGMCRACVCRVKESRTTTRYATVCSEGPVFEASQLAF